MDVPRLISNVSQPIKAFVVVVCVLVIVDAIVLGHRNLTSKFGQNRVRNSPDIVVIVLFLFLLLLLMLLLLSFIQIPSFRI